MSTKKEETVEEVTGKAPVKPKLGQLKLVKLSEVIPYDKNPRKINNLGIKAVKDSIEKYGYNVPITVDEKMVVITGHTRLLACKELKMEEVTVLIATHLTEKQIKEFRIADNRISELSKWDDQMLLAEMRDVGLGGEMDSFFKNGEMDKLLGQLDKAGESLDAPTQEEIKNVEAENLKAFEESDARNESSVLKVVCTHCNEDFHVSRKLANY